VLLRPLPYAHGDSPGAWLWAKTPTRGQSLLSWDEYLAYRDQTGFVHAVPYGSAQTVNLTAVNEPRRIIGVFATRVVLRRLDVKANVAGSSAKRRARPGKRPKPGRGDLACILATALRVRSVGDRRQRLTLNGLPMTVIGVMGGASICRACRRTAGSSTTTCSCGGPFPWFRAASPPQGQGCWA